MAYKHTPEPWIVGGVNRNGTGHIKIKGWNGRTVAMVPLVTIKQIENGHVYDGYDAKLLLSAPKMLRSLQKVVGILEGECENLEQLRPVQAKLKEAGVYAAIVDCTVPIKIKVRRR